METAQRVNLELNTLRHLSWPPKCHLHIPNARTCVPTVEDIGDFPILAFDGHLTANEILDSMIDPDSYIVTSFILSTDSEAM